MRLWRMGFLQILGGFTLGNALVATVLHLAPHLRSALGPLGDALLF